MRRSNSWHPWCAAALGLVALACGSDGPTQPAREPPATAAAITLLSGDDQVGKAGEPLAEAFVVRVTDPRGGPVQDVEVTWRVLSGAGDLGLRPAVGERSNRTDPNGMARSNFTPTTLGASVVTAEAAGLQGSPVTFTAQATGVVIHFHADEFAGADVLAGAWFTGPEGSSDITVPVGTTVEWVLAWAHPGTTRARIASGSAPPGGETFDSGDLTYPARFSFVAAVAGTWEFEDRISGATGTLTAR